tara:strand:+ start:140 stop:310 length:171 start_codon:yes stop_codon:yes gene_type:complete
MSATKRWIEDLQMAGQDPLSNDKHLDDDYQYQEWCHYSGLPNVLAYENHKNKLDEH